MPNTRKKIIKTVFKNEDDFDSETEKTGDFSDSGSDAHISEHSSSEDNEEFSSEEFDEKSNSKNARKKRMNKKTKFAKAFISKLSKPMPVNSDSDEIGDNSIPFSIRDLSEADKLLPSILNLSESDSSDDDTIKITSRKEYTTISAPNKDFDSENDNEFKMEYQDVWSNNIQDNGDEIAKKTFLELEKHKARIDETTASIQKYSKKKEKNDESDVKNLLAQGEEITPQQNLVRKEKKRKGDSDSEIEDWEEVKESKAIPQQGIQLIVEFPDSTCRKTKKLDVEMMMKRKINRVKKEYQVHMHKVHVLCWLGYGNYVSSILNDQDILSAALSLVPSKECYPGERVDIKYVEQITNWYMGKITLKQDKNENKFKPKAPPLKEILLAQIKSRVVTTKKYVVFIFVCMLRALGLQCRVMLNFTTLPIKPPSSELCSLSTKPKSEKNNDKTPKNSTKYSTTKKKDKIHENVNTSKNKSHKKLMQIDGNDDSLFYAKKDLENIMQIDGSDDEVITKSKRVTRATKNKISNNSNDNEGSSPPKRLKKSPNSKSIQTGLVTDINDQPKTGESLLKRDKKIPRTKLTKKTSDASIFSDQNIKISQKQIEINSKVGSNHENNNTKMEQSNIALKKTNIERISPKNRKLLALGNLKENENITRSNRKNTKDNSSPPNILVTEENEAISSRFFNDEKPTSLSKRLSLSKKRSQTSTTDSASSIETNSGIKLSKTKCRTKNAPGNSIRRSKYFIENSNTNVVKPSTSRLNTEKKGEDNTNFIKPSTSKLNSAKEAEDEDNRRISHRHLNAKTKNIKSKNDVTGDLVSIIKNRVRKAKADTKKGIRKEKSVKESDEDSDYLPEEIHKRQNSDSDNEFKPKKISPKPKITRKIDRRVLSSDEDTPKKKIDVWCEVFVEELEQWIAVDVIKGKVHCTSEVYNHATHPVAYIVGWNNNNNLKDLTRKYVPHWNTITRKQRVEPDWWKAAIQPWLGPKTAKDKEEDEQLDRMQLEAPLPKSIAEYKNHPLYALKRHLLKFEAIYPPDAATLGFVRGEPVYARECVYTCRSRDTWLKEAKVVRLGEKPYKVVKARPKWDKLSNKLITDKPLEVFGPWQVQDYEPPVAENGIVPRNAYGNVELFKDCMLPKGTVHIKLPGLNKVAKKLNIDCAPAMTGFEFNGGWSHPVYDGFVVCKEFEEIVTEAWIKDQEEQEKREREKLESRVYGNWKRLIKGLLIRERLKNKYGFEPPSHSQDTKKGKGPRLLVKKKY